MDKERQSSNLAAYTDRTLLFPGSQAANGLFAVRQLSLALAERGWIPELLPFYHAVINREYLASPRYEGGVAIPHVRLPYLKRLVYALGVYPDGFTWRVRDRETINFVFLLAIPEQQVRPYLQLLSEIVRFIHQDGMLHRLKQARTNLEIQGLLAPQPLLRGPHPLRPGEVHGRSTVPLLP